MAFFEVVFHGQVRADVAPEQARARIGQLFQVGDRQLDALFSGRQVVIKQGLDQLAAEKYRQAIERTGAICEIRPAATALSASQDSPRQAAPEPLPKINGVPLQPRDEFMAAFRDVEAPDLPIAPLGADLQHAYIEHAPLDLDLSAFSLAPAGSDIDQRTYPTPPPAPETGHLQLADEYSRSGNTV